LLSRLGVSLISSNPLPSSIQFFSFHSISLKDTSIKSFLEKSQKIRFDASPSSSFHRFRESRIVRKYVKCVRFHPRLTLYNLFYIKKDQKVLLYKSKQKLSLTLLTGFSSLHSNLWLVKSGYKVKQIILELLSHVLLF
jgi:hypothetical protein